MFDLIKKDLSRYKESIHTRGILRLIRNHHGFKATLVYRYGQWLKMLLSKKRFALISLFLYPSFYLFDLYIKKAYGIYINNSALIAEGLQIYHLGGIFVGSCKIGKNFTIHQHVRVQGNSEDIIIGDNVWLGPHAQIMPKAILGSNIVIQAGSVVTSDVKDNCLMSGSPARVVRLNYNNPELFQHYH